MPARFKERSTFYPNRSEVEAVEAVAVTQFSTALYGIDEQPFSCGNNSFFENKVPHSWKIATST